MRLWTLIKIVAGLAVVAVAIFTALLVRHVREAPLGGIFSQLVPVEMDARPVESLPAADPRLPDIDPGAKIFEKAREMIAVGDLVGARERLRTIVSIYPRSKSAPEARRIVGEMNMDELLSAAQMEGKSVHVVQRGENYIGIAAKYKTTLDCIMHLNGLLDTSSLHPGDEIVVMPLELRLLIEPARKSLSLWQEGRFVKEYTLLAADTGSMRSSLRTTVSGKAGFVAGRRVTPGMKGYRESVKVFTLDKSPLQIRAIAPAADGEEDVSSPGRGFFLRTEDAEELALVLRPGNEVEIRAAAP